MWNTWYADGKVALEYLSVDLRGKENLYVVLAGGGANEIGVVKGDYLLKAKYYSPTNLKSRNLEQQAALTLLGDKDVPLKILSGAAGSGKTLMASAHAIHKLEKGLCSKIIIAKSLTPIGQDIGYLKGSMEEKVRPWIGPFSDAFIHCGIPPYKMEEMIDRGELEITPLTFIQGRSISDAVMIIDEVQNIPMDITKQIITRAAAGTEVILLGDPTQVFQKGIKGSTLDTLIDKGEASELVGSVTLTKSVRSPLAQWAVENL
jgi:PhoH-like ATPase